VLFLVLFVLLNCSFASGVLLEHLVLLTFFHSTYRLFSDFLHFLFGFFGIGGSLFRLHHSAFFYFYFLSGLVIAVSGNALHLFYYLEAPLNPAENDVLAIEPWCFFKSNEEL